MMRARSLLEGTSNEDQEMSNIAKQDKKEVILFESADQTD